MYIIKADMKILASAEVQKMLDEYEEKFNKRFVAFNYVDFPGDGTQRPAEMYREELRKALKNNKPYCIVSHRYDMIGH